MKWPSSQFLWPFIGVITPFGDLFRSCDFFSDGCHGINHHLLSTTTIWGEYLDLPDLVSKILCQKFTMKKYHKKAAICVCISGCKRPHKRRFISEPLLMLTTGQLPKIASSMLGKSSQNMFPNGGERWWVTIVQSEKKITKKSNMKDKLAGA